MPKAVYQTSGDEQTAIARELDEAATRSCLFGALVASQRTHWADVTHRIFELLADVDGRRRGARPVVRIRRVLS